MKKTAAIVFVLIAAVMALFATTEKETHVITLRSTVEAQPPAFQLVLGLDKTNSGVAVFSNDASYPPGNNNIEVAVGSISEADIEVTFNAHLANAAKTRAMYTLEFKPGSFSVTRSGVPGTVAPSTASGKTAVLPATGLAGVTVASAGGYKVTATFNGTTCASDSKLADFKVTYIKDPTVDPNDAGYTATVTLEITTES